MNTRNHIPCPRCGDEFIKGFAALSRRDNFTEICPACGTREAFEDFERMKYQGTPYWTDTFEETNT